MKIKRQQIMYFGSKKKVPVHDTRPDIVPLQNKKSGIVAVNLNYLKSTKRNKVAEFIEKSSVEKKWDFTKKKFYSYVTKEFPEIKNAIRVYQKAFIK